jgi:hypothetical protein
MIKAFGSYFNRKRTQGSNRPMILNYHQDIIEKVRRVAQKTEKKEDGNA